jgi:hypothetical protein
MCDRDRILTDVLGCDDVHTVSNANTPNFTMTNSLIDKDEEEEDSVVGINAAKTQQQQQQQQQMQPPSFVVPVGAGSPSSRDEGFSSVLSTNAGFANGETPQHNPFSETPSWSEATPRPTRDRSNSFNEYLSSDVKRHRLQ